MSFALEKGSLRFADFLQQKVFSMPPLGFWGYFAITCVASLLLLAVICYRIRLSPIQLAAWLFANLLAKVWWRARVIGKLPLVPGQGAILVCNHTSSVDPFFLQTLTLRKMHWMVAKEFCEHKLMGIFLRICEVIPVNRGGVDTSAMKFALRKLQAGGIIGMFPEGRINLTEEFMQPVRPGAALIAIKSGVPIIPVYIEGSPYGSSPISPFFMRARAVITIGKPIDMAPYLARTEEEGIINELILRSVKEIALLAGEKDFQPQLAGRNWKPTPEQIAADLAKRDQVKKERAQQSRVRRDRGDESL